MSRAPTLPRLTLPRPATPWRATPRRAKPHQAAMSETLPHATPQASRYSFCDNAESSDLKPSVDGGRPRMLVGHP